MSHVSENYKIVPGTRVLIAGGGGFIGSHLAIRLMAEGFYVVCADWATNIYFEQDTYCNEFHKFDLRDQELSDRVTEGCEEVYDLARYSRTAETFLHIDVTATSS
jgi:nucleoside-diphosphate-sugar epimerase